MSVALGAISILLVTIIALQDHRIDVLNDRLKEANGGVKVAYVMSFDGPARIECEK